MNNKISTTKKTLLAAMSMTMATETVMAISVGPLHLQMVEECAATSEDENDLTINKFIYESTISKTLIY